MASLRPDYEITLGFSFVMNSNEGPSYVCAMKVKSINDANRIIRDDDDEKALLSFLKGYTRDELLNYTFAQRNVNNPFEKSGYIPNKLVCLNVWITKFLSPTTI